MNGIENGKAAPEAPAKPRVLIADDEPGFRRLISYELSADYEVLTAENGEEAVEKVRAGGVDVVVSDMAMPKLNGLEALKAIKEIDPKVEVIMITGYATLESAVEGMRRGAYDFISKPFQMDDLVRLVARALEKRRLSRTVDELKEINRFKSEFLANMSHELRTPMNAILGYTSLQLDRVYGELTPKQEEALRRVEASGRNLLQIINAILDLSKMAAGRMPVYAEDFDLGELVGEVAKMMEGLAAAKGLKLSAAVPAGPYIHSDKTKVKQVLVNLVGNAVKFTAKGEVRVLVDADAAAKVLRLRVSDTGKGIKPADLPLLFQEFRQLDASSTREQGGTGLGLAISRKFAQLLGGDITVESEFGAGTVFTVTLPFESAAKAEVPAELLAPAPAAAGKKVVLAIDDDPEVLRLLADSMHGSGYELAGAINGAEGLALAARLKPFAITLDIMMPHQDGWSVLQALKGDPALRDIPVIMLSIMDNRSLGFAMGVSDYMTKPFERAELLAKLRALEHGTAAGSAAPDVLVADGEKATADYICETLRGEGYRVSAAADGGAALARISADPPDILFLDLMLPGANGLEVLEAVEKQTRKKTAVFVLTSRGLTPAETEELQRRAEAVIKKGSKSLADIFNVIRQKLAGLEKRV